MFFIRNILTVIRIYNINGLKYDDLNVFYKKVIGHFLCLNIKEQK